MAYTSNKEDFDFREGLSLFKLRKYGEAREEFKKCIEIDKDRNPHAHPEIGKLNIIERKSEEAKNSIDEYCI